MMARDKRPIGSKPGMSRRQVVAAGVGGLAAPFLMMRSARAAKQVICRNPGGDYGDAAQKLIYDPFTKATGIEVVTVTSNQAQLLAMIEAKRVEIDWMEVSESTVFPLDERGALAPIDYKGWKRTDPASIEPRLVKERWVGYNITGTAITYSTRAFGSTPAPRDWAEFFDIGKFPQPRMMAAMEALGVPELEFALVADGVAMDKLYPLDVPRALRVFDQVKPKLRKLYKSGAESVQVMSSGEAQLASMWNGRAQAAIDQGVPLAINWNQGLKSVQMAAILKDGPNPENAQLFMDFALQPAIQAEFTKVIPYSSANRDVLRLLSPELIAKLPTNPANATFFRDSAWWYANRAPIADAWQKWVLR